MESVHEDTLDKGYIYFLIKEELEKGDSDSALKLLNILIEASSYHCVELKNHKYVFSHYDIL